MYLPKSKYTGPFKSSGGDKELLYKDTLKPFKGDYFITYKNQIFEGTTPKFAGKELMFKLEYEKKQENKNKIIPPKSVIVTPTETDYKNKKFTRYFSRDKRSGLILELNKAEFNRVKKLPAYLTASIEWWLEGPAEDTEFRGYMYLGAKSRNEKSVENGEKQLRGLKNYIKDLSQFVN